MKPGCLFCSIAHGDKRALVWENEVAAAFNDLHPKAPIHVLVGPKQHVDSLDHIEDPQAIGELMMAVKQVAAGLKVTGRYRVMINVGRAGGQVIDHLHIHILAGQTFTD